MSYREFFTGSSFITPVGHQAASIDEDSAVAYNALLWPQTI